jgi:hypothetical protein
MFNSCLAWTSFSQHECHRIFYYWHESNGHIGLSSASRRICLSIERTVFYCSVLYIFRRTWSIMSEVRRNWFLSFIIDICGFDVDTMSYSSIDHFIIRMNIHRRSYCCHTIEHDNDWIFRMYTSIYWTSLIHDQTARKMSFSFFSKVISLSNQYSSWNLIHTYRSRSTSYVFVHKHEWLARKDILRHNSLRDLIPFDHEIMAGRYSSRQIVNIHEWRNVHKVHPYVDYLQIFSDLYWMQTDEIDNAVETIIDRKNDFSVYWTCSYLNMNLIESIE